MTDKLISEAVSLFLILEMSMNYAVKMMLCDNDWLGSSHSCKLQTYKLMSYKWLRNFKGRVP